MFSLVRGKGSLISVQLRKFHDDDGGESGVQMIMVLALAAVCLFSVGKLAGGLGGGEGDPTGLLGAAWGKLSKILPFSF